MFRFIREHWLAYLIGLALALALGFGAAVFVGIKGSTPEDVHQEEIKKEAAMAATNAKTDAEEGESSQD